MLANTASRRLKVWKMKKNSKRQEFAQVVAEGKKVFEVQYVESKWKTMKEVWLKAAK